MPTTHSTPETFEETVDQLTGTIDAACVEIDRLRTVNAHLLLSVKEFVALYAGTRDMLGPSVQAQVGAGGSGDRESAEVPNERSPHSLCRSAARSFKPWPWCWRRWG
jgi:hypothetical protein